MSDARIHLPALIQQMLSKAFYPHPTADTIQLVQTHLSYVLLSGHYAYKIKKPFNLKFVDFTSLDQRRYFCEEELRLNRRGAPGIYLEVVSITTQPEGFKIGGPGPTIENCGKVDKFP